nr:RagB/SusD family nutrient uptake outer membrane protein [Pseudopedobacter sp.]
MKNKYKIILTTSCLAITLIAGCKDSFLDQSPSSGISTNIALNTEADVKSAVLGMYSGMRAVDLYGRTFPIIGDLLADNSFIVSNNSGRYTAFDRYVVTPANGNTTGIWNSAYQAIDRANRIINSTPAVSVQANVDQYKGEAYAARALLYFDLLRAFSNTNTQTSLGVPIVLSFDYTALPARNTVAQVYTQINADLAKAYTLMTQFSSTARISKYTARAIQARVALYSGDYTNALTYANDVITNSAFSLLTKANYNTYWANAAPQTAKIETLFEVNSDAISNLGFDSYSNMFVQPPGGYGDVLCTTALYNLYSATDVRKTLFKVGSRGTSNPAYFILKFPNVGGDKDDTKVIRLSEVYLIAAEAAYRTNDIVQALGKLNTLVAQRDASQVYASIGTQLLDDIVSERRKELAFEGDRLFDLNRLGRAITRQKAPNAVAATDYRRIQPIPQSELDVNTNIPKSAQNPGW